MKYRLQVPVLKVFLLLRKIFQAHFQGMSAMYVILIALLKRKMKLLKSIIALIYGLIMRVLIKNVELLAIYHLKELKELSILMLPE